MRKAIALVLGVAATAALIAGCSVAASEPADAPSSARGLPLSSPSASPTQAPSLTPLARGLAPISVSIPAIDLSEPLVDLGFTANGGMEVPADFDEVGWFTGGGRPGGYGPLVIAAHVDSPTGPAAFIRLREVTEGDSVEVTDIEGTVHSYRVVEVADYSKSAFPTARVFGAVVADELRLITCGGIFDSAVGSYEDNRVVYATRENPHAPLR